MQLGNAVELFDAADAYGPSPAGIERLPATEVAPCMGGAGHDPGGITGCLTDGRDCRCEEVCHGREAECVAACEAEDYSNLDWGDPCWGFFGEMQCRAECMDVCHEAVPECVNVTCPAECEAGRPQAPEGGIAEWGLECDGGWTP